MVITFQSLAVARKGAADTADESRQLRVLLQLQLTFLATALDYQRVAIQDHGFSLGFEGVLFQTVGRGVKQLS
jgi:hypothetical protein